MKRQLALLAMLAMACFLASCGDDGASTGSDDGSTAVTPVTPTEVAVSLGFDRVKARATESKKRILLIFTGSDWCRFSQLLQARVLDSKEWAAFITDGFEVYHADFPMKTKLGPKVTRLHQQLQKRYDVSKYPAVLALEADGGAIASVDFREDETAKDFVARLQKAIASGGETAQLEAIPLKGAEIHAATGAGIAVDYLKKGVEPGKWSMDYEATVKAAKESGTPILFKFTGSDWCSWCKLMNSKVLRQASWQRFARRNLAMFVLDFPQAIELPEDVVRRNADFQAKFGVQGYPTFVLVEPDGETVVGIVEHDLSPHTFRQNVMEVMRLSSPHVKKICSTLPEAQASTYKDTVGKLKAALEKRRKLQREGQDLFRRGAITEEFEKRFMAVQREVVQLGAVARDVVRGVFAAKLKPKTSARYLRICKELDQAEKNLTEFVVRSQGAEMDMEGLNNHQKILFLVRAKKEEMEFNHYLSRFEGESARTFKGLFTTLQAKRASHRNWLLSNPSDAPENMSIDRKYRDEIAELEDRIDAMKELQLKETPL